MKQHEEATKLKEEDEKVLKEQPMFQVMLQAPTFLPGGLTDTTLNKTRTPGLTMVRLDDKKGLLVTLRGDQAFIPDTNVKIYYLSKNDK